MSKISSGLVLFAVLMALSVGVAFSEVGANVTENATENVTINETENVTINATGNVTVIAENVTINATEPVKA